MIHALREATAYGVALAAGLRRDRSSSTIFPNARYDAEFAPAIGRDEAGAASACRLGQVEAYRELR